MGYKFNPTTGGLDVVSDPGGSDTQIQFNDAGSFGGDVDLTWNKTTNVMTVAGDVNLSDGGSFTTTLQTITPTANRTVSIPDATGTLALVAGSSGQPIYNNAGVYAGLSTATIGTTGNITLSLNGASGVSPVALTGTWFAGTTPQVLIQPSTATAGAWSASGTGIGVNAASGFAGNLLDLQVNGTSRIRLNQGTLPTGGSLIFGGTAAAAELSANNSIGTQIKWGTTLLTLDATGVNLNTSGSAYLATDAANTLAQRNGTNAQTFRVYNTYTSSTNYELGKLEWSSNVFRIGSEAGSGGGTQRPVEISGGSYINLNIGATNKFGIGGTENISYQTLRFNDGVNLTAGTTTGTKIGTSTTEKLGFFNKTPVVQPAAVADATDAATAITQLNALLARMRDLGLIAT